MLLCIHGAGASSGEWLPHLRKLIQTPDQYAGHKLLEACTIQLPGHFCEDQSFDWDWCRATINSFIEEEHYEQSRLFDSLKNTSQTPVYSRLASKELTIIGDELGGAIALYFALNHPDKVSELILVNCGISFSLLSKLQRYYYRKRIWTRSPEKLQEDMKQSKSSVSRRNLSAILTDNSSRKGLKSAYDMMDEYSFKSFFSETSLNNQLTFSQIPICIINGSQDRQASPQNASRIEQIFSTKNPFFKSQQAALTLGAIPTVSVSQSVFKRTGSKAHHQRPELFIETIFDFLQDKPSSYLI